MDPAEVPDTVHEAFHHLKNGRPRPVEIEIPPETLAEMADVELPNRKLHVRWRRSLAGLPRQPRCWPPPGTADLGGRRDHFVRASEAVRKLAEHLQMPVISTAEAKGIISDRHPLSLGSLWLRNDTVAGENSSHDLVLAVGTRLAFPMWLGGQQVIQIDVDETELGRNYDNTFGVRGDARLSLEALLTEVARIEPARADRSAEVAAEKVQREDSRITVEPQESFLAAVRSALPDDGILIAGMTQVGYYSRAYFPVYEPRTFITSSYSGNLGYAYPTALGAKVAQPDKAVGRTLRGRRFPVQLAGTGDGDAVRYQRRGGRV